MKIFEWIKRLWLPAASFLGTIVFVTQFIVLWQGNREIVPWVAIGLGVGGVMASLLYVAFSKEASKIQWALNKPARRIPKYPVYYQFARGGIVLLLALLVAGGVALYLHEQFLESQVIVIIANFDGPDPQNYRVTDLILSRLRESVAQYHDTQIIALGSSISEQEGSNKAKSLGVSQHADLVVWGWYGVTGSDALMTIHIENLSQANTLPLSSSQAFMPEVTVSEIQNFSFQKQLSSDISDLILFISGFMRYQAKDFEGANIRLSTALDSQANPNSLVGEEYWYTLRGNTSLFLQDYLQAISDYDRALEMSPQFFLAYANRGAANLLRGEIQKAVDDFNQTLQYELPDDYKGVAFGNRGIAVFYQGKFSEAIGDFDQGIKLSPAYAPYLTINRSMAQIFSGDFQAADNSLTALIEAGNEEIKPLAYQTRCFAYVKMEKLDQAIRDCNIAIKKLGSVQPKIPGYTNLLIGLAYNSRGSAYFAMQKYPEAIQDFTQAIETYPDLGYAYNNRAIAKCMTGDTLEGLADLKHAASLNLPPDLATLVAFNLGYIYYLQGYKVDAVEVLSNITSANLETLPYGLYVRGNAYYDTGDYEKALADYTLFGQILVTTAVKDRGALVAPVSVSFSDQLSAVLYKKGQTYLALGQYNDAILNFEAFLQVCNGTLCSVADRWYQQAKILKAIADLNDKINQNPQDKEAYYERGQNYWALVDSSETSSQNEYVLNAIADYSQAIEIDPQYAQAYYARGVLQHRLGQKDLALADFTQAVELNPQFALAYYGRASVLREMGEPEKAVNDCTQTITLESTYAGAYYLRALLYKELGNKEEASQDLKRFLELETDPEWISNARLMLQELDK